MSVLDNLASALGKRNDEPNRKLALRLVESSSKQSVAADIELLVENLLNPDKSVRGDCIKVLYEIGYLKPELLEMYVEEFVALLKHKDNRLVWGAMIALGTIAARQSAAIRPHVHRIIETTKTGSAISQDWGIRVLAALAAGNEQYAAEIYPFLIEFLRQFRPKDLASHAERIAKAGIHVSARSEFRRTLDARIADLSVPAFKRVQIVLRQLK